MCTYQVVGLMEISKLFFAVPCLQVKAWQVQADQSKNVVMRLKSSADNSELQTEKAEDMVVCMTAEKFLVLYHGKVFPHMLFTWLIYFLLNISGEYAGIGWMK